LKYADDYEYCNPVVEKMELISHQIFTWVSKKLHVT